MSRQMNRPYPHLADVLAKGANATNTSVEGLAQALSYAAPVANTLGVSLESTVAIIGKFADAGIDASRAGTALNSIMSQFANPLSSFRKELGAAGIVTTNFEEALHQLAAKGKDGERAINAVGLEAGPALRALLNQGMGALDELTGKLREAGGSAEATAKTMADNLNGSLKGLSSMWETVTQVLGKPVLPVVRKGVDELTGALRKAVDNGLVERFGQTLATAFENGLKFFRAFAANVNFDVVVLRLQVFASETGETLQRIGQYATNAGNTVQLAWGVMTAGVNGVLTAIYGLGAAFAQVASKVMAGVAMLRSGLASVTFGGLTDQAVLGTYTREQLTEMGVTLVDPTQIARDDGAGKLMLNGAQVGTVTYATGAVDFNPDVTIKIPKPVYSSSQVSGGGFSGEVAKYRLNYEGIDYLSAPSIYPNDESGYVKIRFRTTGSATRRTLQVTFAPEFDLVTGVQAPVVPGSVLLMPASGQPWSDDGRGVLRVLTAAGFVNRGTLNYATGRVALTSWTAGNANSLRRAACITTLGDAISSAYVFRTAAAPLRPGSLTVQIPRASGGSQNVTAGIDGTISAPGVVGTVDYETGLVRLGFGALVVAAGNETEPWYDAANVQPDGKIFKPQPIVASALRYAAVAYAYLPMNADIIGIDPVRLPSDGKVPIFRPGTLCVVGHTKTSSQLVASNGQTINLARVRLSRVVVRDANGKTLNAGFSVDLEAGQVTFTDVSAMTMPVTIEDRIEDMATATDVQISGEITFNRALTHDYPKDCTYVSSALQASDRRARVSLAFEQQTWIDNVWADAPNGPGIAAKYDQSVSPIAITNAGGSTERWVLQFTTTTQFRVIGEHVGVIAIGDINTICSPVNPATGKPYFTIDPLGWGSGWAIGNILRINTVGAIYPFWVVRTIQPGPETGIEHSFSILARGDVNRPQTN
ncbi:phage tail tape measure protein [Comamonas sp. 26]|uniref:phage tail tape measure protein n=1 Tax=Comamonas sp. 26 TaxID=2035201 RepID=UPI000C18D854|nr:phage tail tape measure protein [Comamonas sp. 26]PIG08789.1 TP901 family phage tail tape measure protein [Comamonas sp. 26]